MSTVSLRICVSVSLAAMLAQGAFAQAPPSDALRTPDVLQKLYACKAIIDPMERLACYDGSVGRVEQAQDSGEFVAIDREAAKKIERDSFGFNIPSLPKLGFLSRGKSEEGLTKAEKKAADTIILAIDRTKTLPRGEIRFFLKNGQVWEQNEKTRISRLSKTEDNFLHIRKASMGSYLAQVNGKGPGARVKRRE